MTGRALRGALLLLLALPVLSSTAAETRRVEGLEFDNILVYGSVEVEVSQGDAVLLQLRGDEASLAKQPFFIDDRRTLVLGRTADSSSDRFSDVRYRLTVVELNHIELVGSGEVYLKPAVVEKFYGAVEGSGDLRIFDLQGEDITLQVSGSGDIEVAVIKSKALQMIVSGSGDIAIGEMNTRDAEVSLNGSGDIAVETGSADQLLVHIVGSGDVDMQEVAARDVEINVVGSGTPKSEPPRSWK